MALTDKQKKKMNLLNDKKKQRILKATNNGRCWWVYQQLIANPRQNRTTR
tara:strand:+ start:1153 stop:1302 length:150 start_codon:yes stop_codon:yes gene_type:complete